jgi:hypothetical protein
VKIIAILIYLSISVAVQAQEWSSWTHIQFFSGEDTCESGRANPSYCQQDSFLYFNCIILFPWQGGQIYSSHFDSTDQYLQDHWSDPVALPEPINLIGYFNTTPDISATGDTLFFSSDRPGTRGGMDIWMSTRESGVWLEPTNLGDSVNTVISELSPDYAAGSQLLFFEREEIISYNQKLYMSSYVGEQTWNIAQELPELINIPGFYTYGPSFDDGLRALYYSSVGTPWDIGLILRANYSDSSWSEPAPLSDSVNGFYYPNDCDRVTTENPDIAGTKLFFSKQVWDPVCTDEYSFLLYSVQLPIAVGGDDRKCASNSFNVYPNPSNGQFVFDLGTGDWQLCIRIYNICGQLVRTLDAEGSSQVIWNGGDEHGNPVPSGIYFVRFDNGEQHDVKKIVLLK